MKLKILSDGTPQGTKVVDSETGEMVDRVKKVRWEIGADRVATALIEIQVCEVDIAVEEKQTKFVTKE